MSLHGTVLVCMNKYTLTFIFMVLKPLSVFPFTEPGYYHEGHFGVRLENVLEVVKKQTKVKQGSNLKTI